MLICEASYTHTGSSMLETDPPACPHRCAHSTTAFLGPMVPPPPSPAHAPCSHPQTSSPDSATIPVIVLHSRALCARLCELAPPHCARPLLPSSDRPAGSATSPVIILYSRALCARLCMLALPPSSAGCQIWVSTSSSPPHTSNTAHALTH